uniref:CUB domain-containing protein n=1 Tax=Rhabditophanes sp. KR3021 TaxID=114890 RepID=A0AC35U0L5_9BILA
MILLKIIFIFSFVTCSTTQSSKNCPSPVLFLPDNSHGAIYSPNFPNDYDDWDDCAILIRVPVNHTIQLTVYAFSTEACCDLLNIYNGAQSELITTISGEITPGTQYHSTSTNQMFIRFASDLTHVSTGFYIDYKAIPSMSGNNPAGSGNIYNCEVTHMTTPIGGISSPLWPSNYPNSATCDYLIEGTDLNSFVSLNFITFSTESCCDILTIYDSNRPDDSKIIDVVRGSNIATKIFNSTGPVMYLRFNSDPDNNAHGFDAIYQILSKLGPMNSVPRIHHPKNLKPNFTLS